MPFYDYACARCGPFEASRRIDERDEPLSCPRCGEASPRRQNLGAASIGQPDSPAGDGAGRYGMRHVGGCLCCR